MLPYLLIQVIQQFFLITKLTNAGFYKWKWRWHTPMPTSVIWCSLTGLLDVPDFERFMQRGPLLIKQDLQHRPLKKGCWNVSKVEYIYGKSNRDRETIYKLSKTVILCNTISYLPCAQCPDDHEPQQDAMVYHPHG